MGIPVSGKNLFPSNIAGLPTWFTIRVSKDGYVARRRETDIAGGDEPRDRGRGRGGDRPGRRDRAQRPDHGPADPRRPHRLPRADEQADRADHHRRPAAAAGRQHDLRRRARASCSASPRTRSSARSTRSSGASPRRSRSTTRRCAPAGSGRATNLEKTRPVPARAHERDRGQDPDRRQHRRRAGRDVRRRHRRDLVSDHAVVEPGRGADRLPRALPPRPGDRQGAPSP